MRLPIDKRPIRISMALAVVCAAIFTLALHTAAARFFTTRVAASSAQAAGFAVTVSAPSGIYAEEEGSGENEIIFYTAGTTAAYTFTVSNNSDVTVLCHVEASGDAAYSLSPNSFTLAVGESQPVVLGLTGANDLTAQTNQQLTLSFLLEQAD